MLCDILPKSGTAGRMCECMYSIEKYKNLLDFLVGGVLSMLGLVIAIRIDDLSSTWSSMAGKLYAVTPT